MNSSVSDSPFTEPNEPTIMSPYTLSGLMPKGSRKTPATTNAATMMATGPTPPLQRDHAGD